MRSTARDEPDRDHDEVQRQVQAQRGGGIGPAVQHVVDGAAQVGAGPPGDRHRPSPAPARSASRTGTRRLTRSAIVCAASRLSGTRRTRSKALCGPPGQTAGASAATANQMTQNEPPTDSREFASSTRASADRPDGAEEAEGEGDRRQLDRAGRAGSGRDRPGTARAGPAGAGDGRPAVRADHQDEPGQGHGQSRSPGPAGR